MSSIDREHNKSKLRKNKRKKATNSIPVSLVGSPYSSKTRLGAEDALFNLTDQDKLLSKLMKKSFRDGQPSTIDFKRVTSLKDCEQKYNRLELKSSYPKGKDLKTKSFIDNIDNKSAAKKNLGYKNIKKHVRHKSDGYNIPLTYSSNFTKYIRHPKRSKVKSNKRSGSRADSENSNIVTSVQILHPNKTKLLGKKDTSIGDFNKTASKRSPSITMLKKKKVISKTHAHNSPLLRSSESLHFRSKSKSKLNKKVSQITTAHGDRTLESLSNNHPKTIKSGVFKARKKAMIAKFCKKNFPSSKNSSPKSSKLWSHSKSEKPTTKKRIKKMVSSRGTSINDRETPPFNNKDFKKPLIKKMNKHNKISAFIGHETQAQAPSQFNASKLLGQDKKPMQIFMMPGSERHTCSTAKSNYVKFRDTKLKSKLIKHMPANRSTDLKLQLDKGIERPRGQEYKKTKFIIPKNLSRETSEEKETLSKYLKENPNVQSCTIHINELLNSGIYKKPRSTQKSMSISKESSLSRIIRRPSSKKTSISKVNSSLERPQKEGLIMNRSHIKNPKTSQSNYSEIMTGFDKPNLKKTQVYLMKKVSKEREFKKKSTASNKYTILKSKKHLNTEMRHKNKSQQISPYSKGKLYNYQPVATKMESKRQKSGKHSQKSTPKKCTFLFQSVASIISNQEVKPKITMNVSIDLSQNQKQDVNLIERNYFQNISARRKQDKKSLGKTFKGQKNLKPLVIEEGTDKDDSSTKRKSYSKYPKQLPQSKETKVMKKLPDSQNRAKKKSEQNYQKYNKPLIKPIEQTCPGEDKVIKDNTSFVKIEKPSDEEKYSDILDSFNFDDVSLNASKAKGENKKFDEEEVKLEIPQKTIERIDTEGTNISALNLSPRSKANKKLKKLIRTTFARTNKAPDTTSEFYKVGKVLGRGAFGKVNLTIHRLTEEMVAIKSLNKEFLTDEVSRKKVMKEVKILKKMRHKNIIQLLDTFETQKHIIFVMELCSGGDLLNYVRKRRKLTEDYAKAMFKQILEALQYCHRLNILHRDIKLDNIILDSQGIIKVGDFGVSKIIDPTQVMYDQCGTPAYIAPEVLRDKGYRGFGIDIWSAGVVLYSMLYGTVPFRAQNMNDLHEMIIKAKYTLKPEISEEARDLLKKILEVDPKKRLTIPQILDHSWFSDCNENLEIFTDIEKEKIKQEFSYNNIKKEYKNSETDVSCDFTEHHLETCDNDALRNLTTKSIILAPFNSTTSEVPSEEAKEIEELRRDRKVLKFNAKCRDFNRQYEMNNNCELDNGVYNKFMESSRASLHFTDSQNDGLTGGNSVELSFNKNKDAEEFEDEDDMDNQIELEIKDQQNKKDKGELSEFELITQEAENNQLDKEEIDDFLVEEVSNYGYPESFIIDSLQKNEINYATASYYILKKQLAINKKHPLVLVKEMSAKINE
ncbi:unnamed protein product [Moneuplotes crassus]|uniref:Protein kinase domain-containing protein n=1 Tax=Euplotes crassus TaxID=5936 RepID=A0AAD1XZL6_EUPCR|nr:unnamed protein product [Moneuplotes crassus]